MTEKELDALADCVATGVALQCLYNLMETDVLDEEILDGLLQEVKAKQLTALEVFGYER